MSISINSNLGALVAQRRLAEADREQRVAFERLGSGLRINHASDDAAGLAIASSLEKDARVYTQAYRNGNDGISLLNIADAGLEQLTDVTVRLRELSEQAANGTYSRTQRLALDTEATQLSREFNRLVASSSFNKLKLLDGGLTSLRLQLGFGVDGSLSTGVGTQLQHNIGTGSFSVSQSTAAAFGNYSIVGVGDFDNDGKADMIGKYMAFSSQVQYNFFKGNGDGTFATSNSAFLPFSSDTFTNETVVDMNADGKLDLVIGDNNGSGTIMVAYGQGNGTFGNVLTVTTNYFTGGALTIGDLNNDGRLDILSTETGTGRVRAYINNGSSFSASGQYNVDSNVNSIVTGDFNGDSKLDMATSGSNSVSISLGNGDGTFAAAISQNGLGSTTAGSLAARDMNHDGQLDLVGGYSGAIKVLFGSGNGTLQAAVSYASGTGSNYIQLADLNGDGEIDILSSSATDGYINTFFNNGDGSFMSRISSAGGGSALTLGVGDFNGDGVTDVATGVATKIYSFLAAAQQVTTIQRLNLTTQNEALASLEAVNGILLRLQNERAQIGASQSRLSIALNNLTSLHENSLAAASRIKDSDIASESARLVRTSILRQTASAVLSQANLVPQIALDLLRA